MGCASAVDGIKISGRVTLVLPWLADADDRRELYGGTERANSSNEVVNVKEEEVSARASRTTKVFADEGEQEAYVDRGWRRRRACPTRRGS